jgi:hypothetical protein
VLHRKGTGYLKCLQVPRCVNDAEVDDEGNGSMRESVGEWEVWKTCENRENGERMVRMVRE